MKVLVTGSKGMLGRHFVEALEAMNLEVICHDRGGADLRDEFAVGRFFRKTKPEAVVHCAALVGGIKANIDGGPKFYSENLLLDQNVFTKSLENKVETFLYIGSSCMYPANRTAALQPESILSGPLESTNYYYALSKISGTNFVTTIASQMGLNWRTFVASNLYGPFDHFDSDKAHLVSSVISKVSAAKRKKENFVEMWGSGTPRREFTFAADFAEWSAHNLLSLERMPNVMNVGFGEDYTVREFYEFVIAQMGVDMKIVPNPAMPSGNMRKLMDSSVARSLGWEPKTNIIQGIKRTIEWYENQKGMS